jgi:hypothetical protein
MKEHDPHAHETNPLQVIKHTFDRRFAAWGIELPPGLTLDQPPASIFKNGWIINYRLVTEAGGEVLEFFASHRMTNDTLNRIYSDGREELVGSCQQFYLAGDPNAERNYLDHNRAFYETVKRRGLFLDVA